MTGSGCGNIKDEGAGAQQRIDFDVSISTNGVQHLA